jgi:hypothetical protein
MPGDLHLRAGSTARRHMTSPLPGLSGVADNDNGCPARHQDP